MVRIKRHSNTRNHQGIKHRPRKPNIPELVYKFLVANEAFDDTNHLQRKYRCTQEKRQDEIIDSTSQTIGRNMSYKARQGQRKDNGRISKSHNVKRCFISKDLPSSYLQKCVDGGGTRKARNYMKKALYFGVESGYLIPSDPTYKILRVSSDLMKSDSRRSKICTCDMVLSKNRNTATRLEDLQEQRRRRRQGRRQRSRSGSRSKRRKRRSGSRSRRRKRYNSPQNPEEVAEDEADDYEIDKDDPKSNIHTDDIEREPKTARSHQSDEEQSTKKAEKNGSDLFIDEDETDDEDEKKRIGNTKS